MIDILIVEDNASFRDMLQATLQLEFPLVRIATASEGVAALHRIRQKKPDLIFMDIRMPGKSGLMLTEEIKRLNPDIAIAIITNLDGSEYRTAAFAMGADCFLSKESVRAEDVQELVERIIADRRRRQ